MVKQLKYQFFLHFIFLMVLGLLIFKPVYHYTAHFNDDEDIELSEETSEPQEEDCCDIEDLYYFSAFDYSCNDIASIVKSSKKRYIRQIIEVYKDVLIPPPKFI